MSSKKLNVLRFAVGSPENCKSWVWRMWVNGDDVYLGARNALQAFKVSLHKSNIWRIAFVEELKRNNSESDRIIFRWKRPGEFAPGWTPSIAILVSSIDAKKPFKNMKIEDSRIQWFGPPSAKNKLIFKVLFSKPETSDDDFKKIIISGDKLVGKLLKKSGEVAWLVLREDPLTEIEIGKITDIMEKTKIHLKKSSSDNFLTDATRALLVVSESNPSLSTQPTILDISLGKENVEIP